MQIVTIDVMNAARSEPCSATSRTTPSTNMISEVAIGRLGRPSEGLRSAPVLPRAPNRRALRVIVTRMITNGTPSARPCCGSQVHTVCSLISSDCTMPSSKPARAVIQNELNRPTSAAPSAGTTNSVYEVGSSDEIGVMRMPDRVASSVAIIQLRAAMRVGEMPIRAAPVSFSAPARVASPKRVKRKTTVSATATTTTMPAR